MERIGVRVIAEVYEGQFRPLEVIAQDQRIPVKRILSAQPIKARKDYDEESGMRYVIRSDHRDFVLVYDQRWWVEV
ncbi:MAG: hypothetical protein PHQ83_10420 [Eubacteriales bacterium]|nr:hypothetical protein [Eubacteriales bacterium]